jgi:rhodanese-related sulfurtransferase
VQVRFLLARQAGAAEHPARIRLTDPITRTAAGDILGRETAFRGVQGTAVCGILGMTVAYTGLSENTLKNLASTGKKIAYEKVYLYPGQHVNYYPGASNIAMKLIFAPEDGRVLGAQAIGREGTEKRIDVIAMAIQRNATVFDLEEAELCYAPQYGAAKDPVNLAGMIAANVLRGDVGQARWEDIGAADAFLLDVRDPSEYAEGRLDGAVNIPLNDLRAHLSELPAEGEIWAYCRSGQRSYYASRILQLNGFNVKNLPGGMLTYLNF